MHFSYAFVGLKHRISSRSSTKTSTSAHPAGISRQSSQQQKPPLSPRSRRRRQQRLPRTGSGNAEHEQFLLPSNGNNANGGSGDPNSFFSHDYAPPPYSPLVGANGERRHPSGGVDSSSALLRSPLVTHAGTSPPHQPPPPPQVPVPHEVFVDGVASSAAAAMSASATVTTAAAASGGGYSNGNSYERHSSSRGNSSAVRKHGHSQSQSLLRNSSNPFSALSNSSLTSKGHVRVATPTKSPAAAATGRSPHLRYTTSSSTSRINAAVRGGTHARSHSKQHLRTQSGEPSGYPGALPTDASETHHSKFKYNRHAAAATVGRNSQRPDFSTPPPPVPPILNDRR